MADATTTDPKLVDVLADLRELEDDCEKDKPREYGDESWGAWAADVARRAQAALLSASQPSAPVDLQAECDRRDREQVEALLAAVGAVCRGDDVCDFMLSFPIVRAVADLKAEVTALHAERDKERDQRDIWQEQAMRYKERTERLERLSRQESSVYRRNVERLEHAEAEAARLRAALETLKALIEKWQKEADEYASDSAYNAAIHCANELEHALKAALDSSGTVPGKTGGA